MKMTWAYVAGFFDGEGHARAQQTQRGRTYSVRFTQNDPEVLYEIQGFLAERGIASGMYLHAARPDKNKPNPCWTLAVQRSLHVKRLLKLLLPRVVVKREQIGNVLAVMEIHKGAKLK
jgi:hypothetical protein